MNPQDKLIEFPSGHSLELKQHPYTPIVGGRVCQHNALIVDEQRGIVECKHCKTEMSPLEALKLLYRAIWWEENKRERQMEQDLKRVTKVQRAAVQFLHSAGITPEKYAARYAEIAATPHAD